MIHLEILLKPVPWAAHQGSGKRAYNPRSKEKQCFQAVLRKKFRNHAIILRPVSIRFFFYMPIPKSVSKKVREGMLADIIPHTKKPDCTNLQKFTEDCLKGIVIKDDNQVVSIYSEKMYAEVPKVVIHVNEVTTLLNGL